MAERQRFVRRGQYLEYATVLIAFAEAAAALTIGALAGSVALLGFGFDSVIEMASGAAVLWRLHHDKDLKRREEAERITVRIVGACFILLAAYVVYESVHSLVLHEKPEGSFAGIVVTVLSFIAMVFLSRAKRAIGRKLGSGAMDADASQTALCAYLSTITLVGVGLNALLGWWWADPVAALAMVPIIVKEGADALRGKSCGECGCH